MTRLADMKAPRVPRRARPRRGGAGVKAYALTDGFGLDRLTLADWPREELPAGHVRIAVEAVSLNRRDLLLVQGTYAPRLRFPAIPCSDVAGRIVEAGAGVSGLAAGERIVVQIMPDWIAGTPTLAMLRGAFGGPVRQGVLRTEIVCSAAAVLPAPAHLSAREAATLPCAALTAWSAVAKFGQARPGRSVLVQGSGGVSIFALQIARRLGAKVVATSSSAEKRARLRELGADAVYDYRGDPQWAAKARAETPEGFDLVVEVAGGESLDQAIRLVRPGGTVATIGVLAGGVSRVTLPLVVMRQVALQGVTCGSREDLRDLLAAVEAMGLRPGISHVVPFANAREAFAVMARDDHFGKIVVDLADA